MENNSRTQPIIKAVLFDVGGVLFSSPFRAMGQFEKDWNLPPLFLGRVIVQGQAFRQLEMAQVTATEFDINFSKEAREIYQKTYLTEGENPSQASSETKQSIPDFTGLGKGLLQAITTGTKKLNDPMYQTAMQLKNEGYVVGVITNNFELPNLVDSPEFKHFANSFDLFIESRLEKIRKPDPKIFRLALDRVKNLSKISGTTVAPENVVFLDDIGENLRGAQSVGIHTILVPRKDPNSAIQKLNSLLGRSPPSKL